MIVVFFWHEHNTTDITYKVHRNSSNTYGIEDKVLSQKIFDFSVRCCYF